MGSIIIAMPKLKDAKRIRDIVSSLNVQTIDICTTGRDIRNRAYELDCGIVICTRRFQDMYYSEIAENLPRYFEILVLAPKNKTKQCHVKVMTLEIPFRASDLLDTVEKILSKVDRQYSESNNRTRRSLEDQQCINRAKKVLMEKNNMTEQEAFRYIQKCSMDSCTNIVETAQMILQLQDK